jgi:TatD DNase family protein
LKIDTHLHLDEPWLSDDELRRRTIDDITANKIVTWAQSCDIPSYEKTLEFAKHSEYVFPSFGILPWYANDYMDRLDEVARLCDEALMLGEIGLHEGERIKSTTKEQDALFEVFLEAAEKNNKIMNCHFRNGLEPKGLEIMKSYGIKKGIFHSYSGPPEMIDELTENGFYISYGSPSFRSLPKKHREYFEARIPKVHEDFLIIEIDVLAQGKSFRPPSEIFPAIVKTIARMRETTPEEIVALNHKNVLRLIGDDSKLKPMADLLKL